MFDLNYMEITLPSVNQRIKNIIDTKYSGNITVFSKALGYDKPQKVNRLFKLDDRTKKFPVPSTEMLEDISNKFAISLDELVKGKKMSQISNSNEGVPYYDSDITGSITRSFQDIPESPAFFIDFKPFNDCEAYFTLHGDSMYPKYQAGEILAVKRINNKNSLQWGEAYLIIGDSTVDNLKTVKCIHPSEKDNTQIILRATNPNFKGDTPIYKDAIISMFIVKGKIKKEQL